MSIDFTRTRYAEPDDSLGYLLHQLASLWRRQMNARLAEIGLTHTQFIFLIGLAWLAHDGAEVTQEALHAHCTSHLARFKAPKQFVFVEQVRRLGNGKADYRWAKSVALQRAPQGVT